MKTGGTFMPKWLDLNEVDDDEILLKRESDEQKSCS